MFRVFGLLFCFVAAVLVATVDASEKVMSVREGIVAYSSKGGHLASVQSPRFSRMSIKDSDDLPSLCNGTLTSVPLDLCDGKTESVKISLWKYDPVFSTRREPNKTTVTTSTGREVTIQPRGRQLKIDVDCR